MGASNLTKRASLRSVGAFALGVLSVGIVMGQNPTERTADGASLDGKADVARTDDVRENPEAKILDAEYQKRRKTVLIDRQEFRLTMLLDRSTTVQFENTPLSDVADFFQDFLGCSVLLDPSGLRRAQVESDRKVSVQLKAVPTRIALETMLEPLGLAVVVRHHGIVITDLETARVALRRVYPVADLVDAPNQEQADAAAKELIATIEETVNPDSWKSAGGDHRIHFYRRGLALVVLTDCESHRQIEGLLDQLRSVHAETATMASKKMRKDFDRFADILSLEAKAEAANYGNK